ncbi:Proteasomal ubiquitin receptor ADRM1 [Trichinella pseudospiralis]|uniref:Proteasomal ubiquitin receptor ADRM1 homolog n=1 Tax=Trichinella pseudospiralis TaxID=6337 RepID=A0A0V0YGV3_TRIPS|nr:Proteasomal ubiquitin receptor ADRM1 [Trichinella pseudospiralis]
MALFSNRREQSSPFLLEFRAGKMQLRGTTVYPDHRKGLVYVHQSEDSLMHFCWKDRTTGIVEDDLILFPEDVEFVPVPQCNSGRVFLLKFKNSNRRMFFWMQEPQSNRDEEYCRRVNELLNNPPALGSNRRGEGRNVGGLHELTDHLGFMNQLLNLSSARRGGKKKTGISGAAPSAEERMDWQSSLSGINQSQLVELLNLMGSGSPVLDQSGLESLNAAPFLPMIEDDHSMMDASEQQSESTQGKESASATQGNQIKRAAGESTAQIKVEDLRSIFSSLSAHPINLDTVFTPKALSKILSQKQYVERLCEYIPKECEKNYNEIETTLRSPQFIQCLRVFSKALQAGHLAPVFEQFRFPESTLLRCSLVWNKMLKNQRQMTKTRRILQALRIRAAVFPLSTFVALSAAEGGLEGCVFGFGTFCSKGPISFFSSNDFHKLYIANICFSISKIRSVSTEISANQLFMSLPSNTKAMCKQARAI